MGIITKEMVQLGIKLSEPSVLAILKEIGTTWGSKWVVGFINAPNLDFPIKFEFGNQPDKDYWDKIQKNPNDFCKIAKMKCMIAEREKMTTSLVVKTTPWVLKNGEFLYPGGVYSDGISCGVSGAKGWADECIAKLPVNMIQMLAHLDTDIRIMNKEMMI